MSKIYCVFCGTENKVEDKKCSKCKKELNPLEHPFKDYIYNHIKDDLKGKATDSIISLLKNFIKSHLYGSLMTAAIIFTVVAGIVSPKADKPSYESVAYKPIYITTYEPDESDNDIEEEPYYIQIIGMFQDNETHALFRLDSNHTGIVSNNGGSTPFLWELEGNTLTITYLGGTYTYDVTGKDEFDQSKPMMKYNGEWPVKVTIPGTFAMERAVPFEFKNIPDGLEVIDYDSIFATIYAEGGLAQVGYGTYRAIVDLSEAKVGTNEIEIEYIIPEGVEVVNKLPENNILTVTLN